MENCCAPQWVDFTEPNSPQVPTKDYFEKEHSIHGHITEFCDTTLPDKTQCLPTDICCDDIKAQQDLQIIKSTPVKVISPKYGTKKKMVEEETTTYEQVFSNALKKLDLCNKVPSKVRDPSSKITQESNNFKTPNMPIVKSSRSIGFRSVPNKCTKSAVRVTRSMSKNVCALKNSSDDLAVNKIPSSLGCSLLKQDAACTKDDIPKKLNDAIDESEEGVSKKEEKSDDEKDNRIILPDEPKEPLPSGKAASDDGKDENNKEEMEDDVVDATIETRVRTQPFGKQRASTSRTSVLTWQNGRRSLNKRRISSQYVGLAELVSRYQNDTPKRFRTKSNRDLVEGVSQNLMKSMIQNRVKPTIPVSPALTSKNRIRTTTVLSREEREKQELEEMKKYRIKANPIPASVLRGPVRAVSKVGAAKKTETVNKSSCSSSATRQSSTASAASTRSRDQGAASSSRNTVTKVLVTDPTGIIVEREEIAFFGVPKDLGATRGVTRVIPFSFEARNKDLQMKKEQRLKNLSEANKAKAEFHARPVPNFSKLPLSTTPAAKQTPKKSLPCPFSFDERDKNLSKRKEQMVKQVLEKDKQSRVFRASPVPVFKPVLVRGLSKERLPIKEKDAKAEEEEHADRHDNQENEEPNIVASGKMQDSDKYTQKTKSADIDKQNIALSKGKEKELDMKIKASMELNTDKRAKERREFNERMKRKEMEEETKRQEENKKRLEQEKQMKAELRKLTEVKARPMPTFKPMIVVKTMKPLTEPQSPAFANKLKTKQT